MSRFRPLLLSLAALLIVGGGGWWIWHERREREVAGLERQWEEFVERCAAMGESLAAEDHLPPVVDDRDNFAAHPLVRGILDGAAREPLSPLDPIEVEGFRDWMERDRASGRRPMPAELAARITDYYAGHAEFIDAFTEAASRPACRIPYPPGSGYEAPPFRVGELAVFAPAVEALAHAAVARPDAEGLTRHLGTLLRAGNHLRASNSALAMVVGSGFEARAYDVLEELADPASWPADAREEWLAALRLRERPVADEMGAVLRVERGMFLDMLETIESAGVQAGDASIPGDVDSRRFFPAVRLTYCQPPLAMVLAPDGQPVREIDPKRLDRLHAWAKDFEESTDYAQAFAASSLWQVLSMRDALLDHEVRREKLIRVIGGDL